MTVDGGEQTRADGQRNRAAILDAAAEVLAGDASASLAEVAAHAGLSRATLYRHFENREVLRVALRDEVLARAGAALAAANLETYGVREGIHRATSVLVPLGVRFRILLAEGADTDPTFLAARDRTLRPLFELLGRGVAAGDLTPGTDPRWLAMELAGLLMTAVRAASAGVIAPEEAGDLVCRALFDGFGRR